MSGAATARLDEYKFKSICITNQLSVISITCYSRHLELHCTVCAEQILGRQARAFHDSWKSIPCRAPEHVCQILMHPSPGNVLGLGRVAASAGTDSDACNMQSENELQSDAYKSPATDGMISHVNTMSHAKARIFETMMMPMLEIPGIG